MPLEKLPAGRIVGPPRRTLAHDLRLRYETGTTIRDLAEEIDRSYGFVHKLLIEAGTGIRARGGSRPRKS